MAITLRSVKGSALTHAEMDDNFTTLRDVASHTSGSPNFDDVDIGGGYGSTGCTIAATGNIQTDGTLTVDLTSTLTGACTYAGSVLGAWTTPAFDAGDFTANGSMTWTVAAGDVDTFAYTINNKMMTVVFNLVTTTVGGTPSTNLLIKIPASKTATKTVSNPVAIRDNDVVGGREVGIAQVTAGATNIAIALISNVAFAGGADLTYVQGQITFEID